MHSQGGNYVKTVFYWLRRSRNISVTGERGSSEGGAGVCVCEEGRGGAVYLTGLLYTRGAEVEITMWLCGDVTA